MLMIPHGAVLTTKHSP